MATRGTLLLGIDIGTSSSKGVLCTPGGEVLAESLIDHETRFPAPGRAEHDAETIWWGEVVGHCRRLLSGRYAGIDVGAVAVSAIGPCMLPVDDAGRPLRPGILYGIDSRASAEIAWLEGRFGREAMFALNGMALTSQAVGPKILWLRRHEPEIFARTAIVHSASSWIVHRLTGEHVAEVAFTQSDVDAVSTIISIVDSGAIDFDLAVNLFSGAPADPPSPDFIMRNAMDAQEIAIGWWPGDARYPAAAFYGYAHPAPPEYAGTAVEPPGRWEPDLGEFVLDWEDLRAADDPHRLAVSVLRSLVRRSCAVCGWDPALAATAEGVPPPVR